jgi:hypothetical protein
MAMPFPLPEEHLIIHLDSQAVTFETTSTSSSIPGATEPDRSDKPAASPAQAQIEANPNSSKVQPDASLFSQPLLTDVVVHANPIA